MGWFGAARDRWSNRFGDRWGRLVRWLAPPPEPGPAPGRADLGRPGEKERKQWVRRWFRPSPPAGVWLSAARQMRWGGFLALLALCLLVAAPWGFAALVGIVAVTLFTTGFVTWRTWHFAFAHAEEKPTHHHLDRTLDADLGRIAQQAMQRFRVTPDDLLPGPTGRREPVVVCGPATSARHRPDDTTARVLRFTRYVVAVVCATPDRLQVLTGTLTLESGGLGELDTHDVPWRHVAALRCATRAAKELSAHEVPGFPSPKKSALVSRELEISATDGAHLVLSEETTQPRPVELRRPVPLLDVEAWLSGLVATAPDRTGPRTDPEPAGPRRMAS
ncbi:hypothetical protein [Pseudonocardia oroxyli]|uniref:Uncharacterized protein n=1 Tax=Pseudonocardia oroxyli TaxID=366584 RepID=A0A1G7ZU48_PSEOR|nr:hypothetical protein [Pseudonocardia oroxyli]SDH12213.1 hypothetical protein SAMN05216377_11946 [Pseudonocardia oroxyli]